MRKNIVLALAVLWVATAGFVLFELNSVGIFPSKYLLMAAGYALAAALLALVLCRLRIVLVVLSACGLAFNCVLGTSLLSLNTLLANMTKPESSVITNVSVWTLNGNKEVDDVRKLNGKTVGVLDDMQEGGTKLCIDRLAEQGAFFLRKNYVSVPALVDALYSGEVPAIVLGNAQAQALVTSAKESGKYPEFATFLEKTDNLYTSTYLFIENALNDGEEIEADAPYTILVEGRNVDQNYDEVSAIYQYLLVTVNPDGKVLVTEVPDNLRLPVVCDAVNGCPAGSEEDISYMGFYGTNIPAESLEKLLSIDIAYTLEVNWDSVDLAGFDLVSLLKHPVDWSNAFHTDMPRSQLEGLIKQTAFEGKKWSLSFQKLEGKEKTVSSEELGIQTKMTIADPESIESCVKAIQGM